MPDPEVFSDDALLLRFARGDGQAAALLTQRLAPRCVAFATRMLNGDRAEAEDVTQEAMLRLWRQAPKWDAHGSARPGTWLLKVAGNLCIDRLRRARTLNIEAIAAPADPAPGALAKLEASERLVALDAALATLPDRQRQAVVLRHIEGWSNPDIATVMEISVEAAESLLGRGKRALTQALAPRREELSDG
ncbi:sigma-70 family RNA polymerase sigma factor [Thalassobacter stenotrophicus]|uniref:Sigma-W factor n=2 Tax=Thalassobacter stenotrophicus TaxID=266809 RepID=A0A0N7LU22_9RHOB|nr:sigma-70 family RNA polymerase sigma factor [Thalassobacter stenotrophicus]PVZ48752.1 RNA polymerase subunit sigma [Thalassobacter stenotrophicus]CUH62290.1 Sigma-W factor [Thalassobacter stenotrophicus]SHI30953.1 RNA polymerase, sigma subunit, ECF family [Thalassobacter stenotrophicus DSM 16310]